jgi:hypothetical protein
MVLPGVYELTETPQSERRVEARSLGPPSGVTPERGPASSGSLRAMKDVDPACAIVRVDDDAPSDELRS